jgi:hypothetical protein
LYKRPIAQVPFIKIAIKRARENPEFKKHFLKNKKIAEDEDNINQDIIGESAKDEDNINQEESQNTIIEEDNLPSKIMDVENNEGNDSEEKGEQEEHEAESDEEDNEETLTIAR